MPISTSIRDPALPIVSLTVAIAAESRVRGRLAGELGARGQAEGCVLQNSRALAIAAHWLGPGLKATEPLSYPPLSHLMVEAFSMDGGQWNPQQQECMDTVIKITASTSLSLPIQVPKIGTVEMGYLLIGSGQRSE